MSRGLSVAPASDPSLFAGVRGPVAQIALRGVGVASPVRGDYRMRGDEHGGGVGVWHADLGARHRDATLRRGEPVARRAGLVAEAGVRAAPVEAVGRLG